MTKSNTLFASLALGVALLSLGCASKIVSTELGRDRNAIAKDTTFETALPGYARVEVRSVAATYRCSGTDPKTLPRVDLIDPDGQRINGRVTCVGRGMVAQVDFPRALKAGRHVIKVVDAAAVGAGARAIVLFAPLEPEKTSGPNQNFQGASELKVGANEGEVAPAVGNRTDWWRIEMPSLTLTSFAFQHDVDQTDAVARVYRMVNGHLRPTATLTSGRPRTLRLEGVYYVSVQGARFGKTAKYSLAVAKMDSAATNALARAHSTENISIVDLWAVSPQRTAIVLGAGAGRGIKPGDVIKVFGAHNVLLEGCTVGGVSESESECTIERTIPNRESVRARRSL